MSLVNCGKRRGKTIWSGLCALVEHEDGSGDSKIAKGPIEDPRKYLRAFSGMPSNFRPSVLRSRQ